jgi:apolipoprotein N-acyltransferase
MIQKLNYFTNKSSSPKLLLLVLWIILPLALTLVSFISWNFTGMFFVGFLIVVFYHVNYCENLTFNKFILRTLILLTTWHVGALFWMFEIDKGVYGLFANLLVHLIPFVVFYCLKKTHNLSTLAFIPIWLLFEYIQNSYHFSYPWLTLGNLLSNQTYLAQWYQFTGVLGGSFWLLLISYLLFQYFFVRNKYLKSTLTIILLPPVISICLLEIKLKEESLLDTERFITYNNQYNTQNWQKDKLAFEIIKNIDTLKKYKSLIVPEQTFRGMYNKKFSSTLTNHYFRNLIDNGVVENVFLGSTGFIKKDFLVNAALVVTKDTIYGKVKKRLVPYTEFMFPKFYPYFNKKFYRGDVEDTVEQITNTLNILPIICYESVYSLFVTDKIKNASYIYILSSEHFMDNNKYGMSQYDNIIKLRAIENNRPIIKASNFGWSMAISPSGKVLDKSNEEINYFEVPVAKNNFSFYNNYGRPAILGSILFFLICTFYKPRKQA